jgi:hypothetical protein
MMAVSFPGFTENKITVFELSNLVFRRDGAFASLNLVIDQLMYELFVGFVKGFWVCVQGWGDVVVQISIAEMSKIDDSDTQNFSIINSSVSRIKLSSQEKWEWRCHALDLLLLRLMQV